MTGLFALSGEAIFLGCYLGVLQNVLQTVLAVGFGSLFRPALGSCPFLRLYYYLLNIK